MLQPSPSSSTSSLTLTLTLAFALPIPFGLLTHLLLPKSTAYELSIPILAISCFLIGVIITAVQIHGFGVPCTVANWRSFVLTVGLVVGWGVGEVIVG